MTHSIIFTTHSGRLGNQLNNYATLLAFKIKNPNFEIVDLPIIPYLCDYGRLDLALAKTTISDRTFNTILSILYPTKPLIEKKMNELYGNTPKRLRKINRAKVIHKIAHYKSDTQSLVTSETSLPGSNYNKINLFDKTDSLKSKKISVIADNMEYPGRIIEKYSDEIRSHMMPGNQYKSSVSNSVKQLRETYDELVGVHIRQGDYKWHNNGKNYFSSKEYLDIIEKYERKNSDKSLAFIIVSDENQDNHMFKSKNYFLEIDGISTNEYMVDFYKLMNSDIIIGPTSTFSKWAAIFGEIPMILIHDNIPEDKFLKIENPIIHEHARDVLKERNSNYW